MLPQKANFSSVVLFGEYIMGHTLANMGQIRKIKSEFSRFLITVVIWLHFLEFFSLSASIFDSFESFYSVFSLLHLSS